jgi:hypothetical protein
MTDFTPKELFNDIDKHGEGLNEWEERFIASIADRIEKDLPLSQKQIEKLTKIHIDRVA